MRLLALATVMMATVLTFGSAQPAQAGGYPALFNSAEKRSSDLAPFPKWRDVLSRTAKDKRAPEKCKGSTALRCHLKDWRRFLDGLKGAGRMAQIKAVNREMNRRRYIVDPRNWGVTDYWASPLQFFRKQGDCEDYAIAKFISLRQLGVPNQDMRLVVLKDLNLGLAHAILVVYHGGKAYVLDNQISRVVQAKSIRHYRPVYSVNEDGWWLHLPLAS